MNRRTFISKSASTTALATAMCPVRTLATRDTASQRQDRHATLEGNLAAPSDSAFMRTLANRAVEAAIAAGASYAEARATRNVRQNIAIDAVGESEVHGLSVRAFAAGGCGFSASPYWTDADAVKLGQDAARQATANARYVPTPITLAPSPVVTGAWSSPMRTDPFSVALHEKMDFLRSVAYTPQYRELKRALVADVSTPLTCARDEHVLVTSEGTAIAQSFFSVDLGVQVRAMITDARMDIPANHDRYIQLCGSPRGGSLCGPDTLQYVVRGAGWESIAEYDFYTRNRTEAEARYQDLFVRHESVVGWLTPGRYAVVFGPTAMRQLLHYAIGQAMRLDRITMRLANTDGTSYLGQDPLALMNRYDFGTPLLSVSAVPWLPGTTPTHRWDNEGVVPEIVPLVTEGIVRDFATTREQATWIQAAYQSTGRRVASHGYSQFTDWISEPSATEPRLVMTPGKATATVSDIIAAVPDGIYVERFTPLEEEHDPVRLRGVADAQLRQLRLPLGESDVRTIKNGRLGSWVTGASVQRTVVFDCAQQWKSLNAVGGPSSQHDGTIPCLFHDITIL